MEFSNIVSPEELLEYMKTNVRYGFISKSGKIYNNPDSNDWNDWYSKCIVQTGKEVLYSCTGTCWDQVELERFWFENNNYVIKTYFICFDVDYENNYPTHTFLLFKNNGKWYWFEHAWLDQMGIHEFNSEKEVLDYIMQKFFEAAINDELATKEDRKLVACYEYTKLDRSLSVEEYIKHATKVKII